MIKKKKIKMEVDLLIINNVPSFFKVNLYNALAQKCRIHVIFLALTDQAIIKDSFMSDMKFSYSLISQDLIEKRDIFRSFRKLFRICNGFVYRKLVFGGYADLESLILMFLMPKQKNCLQFESTIKESIVSGLKALAKKIVFNRHAVALPAGALHAAVFKTLGYKGRIMITNGVGFVNKHELLAVRSQRRQEVPEPHIRYLYVGRLTGVKNLEFLISVFNKTGNPLTIVGTGELYEKLIEKAAPNISFGGFISHEQIHKVYQQHDVLVLPSKSETWGLVAEEAICAGLPVVVSSAVGCQIELVEHLGTGVIFDSGNEQSLIDAMSQIEAAYHVHRNNCLHVDFDLREQSQIDAFLQVLVL